jgi:hypothetical protein
MNKATLTFIYGSFIVLFFGVGAAISISDIIKASYSWCWEYLILLGQLHCMVIGYNKIKKVIY